jgi:hypothetical protein
VPRGRGHAHAAELAENRAESRKNAKDQPPAADCPALQTVLAHYDKQKP